MEKYDTQTLINMLQQIKRVYALEWEEYKAVSETIGILAEMQVKSIDLSRLYDLP